MQGEALRDLAIAEGRTIEVGLALGMSALALCQAVLRGGGRHVAIDPFQKESWNGAGLRTLREAGVEALVEVIEEESQLALPRLVYEVRAARGGQHVNAGRTDGGGPTWRGTSRRAWSRTRSRTRSVVAAPD